MATTILTLALGRCNKIRERYNQASSTDDTTSSSRINREQRMVVYNKVLETQGTLQILERGLPDEGAGFLDVTHELGKATQELLQVLTRAYETFFKDGFSNEGMESALKQHGDLKETVSEILYDLQWCRSVLCSILLKRAKEGNWALKPEDCDGKLSAIDKYALSTAAKNDNENLKTLLRDLKKDHTCSEECWSGQQVISQHCLAAQLLEMIGFRDKPRKAQQEYMNGLPEHDRDMLNKWPLALLINPKDLSQAVFLDSGAYGNVFRTVWLEETYAMKIPKGSMKVFKQEIAALAGLHHPHVMRLVCCTELRGDCSYIMELMDMTVFKMLEKRQISDILQAVDLMLQVAEGMKYLHSLGLVHRDLKPDNILVKKVQEVDTESDSNNLTSCPLPNPVWVARVSDFGTSKAKNESTAYSHRTINVGTPMYMAPEVCNTGPDDEKPERFYPMKTDVYSFGILCSAVMTGNPSPFETGELVPMKDFKDSVRQGKRPDLPADCPARLAWLIKRCWNWDPLSRPSFHDICKELRYIKGLHLTDDTSTLAYDPSEQDRNEGFQMEGPWGGEGGTPFFGDCVPMSIRSIEIHYVGDRKPQIWHLKIGYEFNGRKATAEHGHGMTPPDDVQKVKVSFEPQEFLTQVEGYQGVTNIHALSALTFHTNLNKYGPYGGGKEPNFTHFQSSVGKIVGFFGLAGAIIDALGVFMSHKD